MTSVALCRLHVCAKTSSGLMRKGFFSSSSILRGLKFLCIIGCSNLQVNATHPTTTQAHAPSTITTTVVQTTPVDHGISFRFLAGMRLMGGARSESGKQAVYDFSGAGAELQSIDTAGLYTGDVHMGFAGAKVLKNGATLGVFAKMRAKQDGNKNVVRFDTAYVNYETSKGEIIVGDHLNPQYYRVTGDTGINGVFSGTGAAGSIAGGDVLDGQVPYVAPSSDFFYNGGSKAASVSYISPKMRGWCLGATWTLRNDRSLHAAISKQKASKKTAQATNMFSASVTYERIMNDVHYIFGLAGLASKVSQDAALRAMEPYKAVFLGVMAKNSNGFKIGAGLTKQSGYVAKGTHNITTTLTGFTAPLQYNYDRYRGPFGYECGIGYERGASRMALGMSRTKRKDGFGGSASTTSFACALGYTMYKGMELGAEWVRIIRKSDNAPYVARMMNETSCILPQQYSHAIALSLKIAA